MGHERVGHLPKTQRWSNVVAALGVASRSPEAAAQVANATLQNVQGRLERIERDGGVVAALEYLIFLTKWDDREGGQRPQLPDLSENPAPARLALDLCRWVDKNRDSLEYAQIAKQAAGDTIASWSERASSQTDLFPDKLTLGHRWHEAATAAGFSEVARGFFASFTERYLKYFLDREASASVESIADRNQLTQNLTEHVDVVSRHAFETSKIAQSFAAGWYARYARTEVPTRTEIANLVRLAFAKIREELKREVIRE